MARVGNIQAWEERARPDAVRVNRTDTSRWRVVGPLRDSRYIDRTLCASTQAITPSVVLPGTSDTTTRQHSLAAVARVAAHLRAKEGVASKGDVSDRSAQEDGKQHVAVVVHPYQHALPSVSSA